MNVVLETIGFVRGGRVEPTDDDWDREVCEIELDTARLPSGVTAARNGRVGTGIVFLTVLSAVSRMLTAWTSPPLRSHRLT